MLSGHFGQENTCKLISRDFYWPGMTTDLKDYVNRCYDFNCKKFLNHPNFRLLKKLPMPPLSFIEDCFSKITLFVSSFWTSLCQHFKIKLKDSIKYSNNIFEWLFVINRIIGAKISYLTLFTSHLLLFPQFTFPTSSIFKINFESIFKQPVNPTSNKPTSFESNLLLSALLDPFKIESVVLKNTFKIFCISKWKAIHPVFHVSLQEPAKGLYHPPPEPIKIQDHLEWEVICIPDSRLCQGKLHSFVKWTGYQISSHLTSQTLSCDAPGGGSGIGVDIVMLVWGDLLHLT
ncbi:uncharacterized protein VP01_1604g6 [Puccinia sorghi]|uniref:Integrase zinc-binding domain-containing protein n=1 Tax=Puccinia sorghi TaxID=27349 RepID=A0A0L6VJ42_9BASI|nr:uncharacterized protein VP01_1604g6 [Puccinia sorghi]